MKPIQDHRADLCDRFSVDGLEIKSAEAEDKNGRTVYEISGMANGVKHEVKITADGEVLKVKTED